MEIKVLGTGCPKCNALEKTVKEIILENSYEAELKKVTDIREIARHGVMLTPALVINGKIKSTGKALARDEIKKYIEEEK